jgi:hypothetical protein
MPEFKGLELPMMPELRMPGMPKTPDWGNLPEDGGDGSWAAQQAEVKRAVAEAVAAQKRAKAAAWFDSLANAFNPREMVNYAAERQRAAEKRVEQAKKDDAVAAEQAVAAAAIAEVEKARESPSDPINAAHLKLEGALNTAIARKRSATTAGDRRWVESLEAAIAEAVEAGVEGEQVRNARERLGDCQAQAELEAAEFQVEMAMRRVSAPSAGLSQVAELVRALVDVTAGGVGVNPALVKAARSLVTRKGNEKQIEMVRLYDRLDRFKTLARVGEVGEKENAERMIVSTQKKLEKLLAEE